MMSSLFETFDPLMSTLNLNMSIMMMIVIVPFMSTKFMKELRQNNLMKHTQKYMFSELSASVVNKNQQFKMSILTTMFMMILTFNLLGLIPYVYTATSQMMLTLSLALPLWMGIMLFNIMKNTNHFLSHLVPLSTPLMLSQFMTIIETISQIIRPITLSVRLCANMTAGHILMALASTSIIVISTASFPLFILVMLELAVAFIQSYVFTMLASMYISELE